MIGFTKLKDMRISRTIVVISLGLLFLTGNSQTWPKIYGSDISAYGTRITESYDNGYIIIGSIFSGQVPIYGWIIKTDINGEVLWDKKFGDGICYTGFDGIDNSISGGWVIAGSTTKYDSWYDPFVVKLNSCGEIEWCKLFHTANSPDFAVDVLALPEGGYMALVRYFGYDLMNQRIWLFKLDDTGEIIWQKLFAQADPKLFAEDGSEMIITSESDILITGWCYYPNPGDSLYGWNRPYLIKVKGNGDEVWELPWGIYDYFYGDSFSSVEDSTGSFYTAGRHNRIELPGDSPCLLKTSSSGQQVFYKDLISNSSLGIATVINIWNDTTLALSIAYELNDEFYVSVITTDFEGNVRNEKVLITGEANTIRGCQVTHDGKLIGVGGFTFEVDWDIYAFKLNQNLEFDSLYTQPYTYDSLCPYQITSDTTDISVCGLIVDLDEIPEEKPEKTMRIKPNPANSIVYIELPQYTIVPTNKKFFKVVNYNYSYLSEARLLVYNSTGKLIEEIPCSENNYTITVNVNSWPPGLYIVNLIVKNILYESQKLIVID